MDNKNNTGIKNIGYRNSGNWNSGNWNSGNWNSGNWNSGNWNSGDLNSGYWNSGDRNSGIFNTNEPKMRTFNKECDLTYTEFRNKFGYQDIDLPLNEWIDYEDMSEEEKKNFPIAQQMDGYLKTLDYKEAWKVGWEKATKEQKEWYKSLPNFDAKIFKEITGIDVDVCDVVKEGQIIEVVINGKKLKAQVIK